MSTQQFGDLLVQEALFDPLSWWGRVDGKRTAVIDSRTGARYSYASLNVSADAWAQYLHAHGARAGDRVAVMAQNRVEFIALLFACIRLGAVLVPLNWRLAAAELSRVLADAEPMLVLGEQRWRDVTTEALSMSMSIYMSMSASHADAAVSGAAESRWVDLDDASRRVEITPTTKVDRFVVERTTNDAVLLLYTSGSTGAPKGVIIPHRQLLANAIATTTAWALGAEDVGPAATPFFHTGGWNVFTTPLLYRGGTVVMIESFDAARYFETLTEYGVTVTFGVPTQLAMLRESPKWGTPLPKLRWFIAGGAPCPQRIKDDVRAAGYRIREGYGLTECGPNCFATNDETSVLCNGSVGWPVPMLQMRLRGDDGALVGDDTVGELELRGPQLFGGYFRAPQKTADVMTPDGWLRTGDLAHRDVLGVYTICGRRKEMFISGGENVFPGEVEAALLDCEGVREASVIGVADGRWGEVGCAVVVRANDALVAADLLAQLRRLLAGYKVPRHVQFVDALPRLGSGKVDRRALAELVAGVNAS